MKAVGLLLSVACSTAIVGCDCASKSCCPLQAEASITPSVTSAIFGKTASGETVHEYTLVGAGGVTMQVLNWGGAIRTLNVPGRDGKLADVTLGFNDIAGYEADKNYFGTLIGRYTNRIGKGKFDLDGKTYTLSTNELIGDTPTTLHGGKKGFDKCVWDATPLTEGDTVGLKMTHISPDGDQGFPGTLTTTVTYRLTPNNVWRVDYDATTDKPTVINMTSHVFFNLKGEGVDTILDHTIQIDADQYSLVDKTLVPDGNTATVEGTPLDFTKPHVIGDRINDDHPMLKAGGGYDLNYILRNQTKELARAVKVWDAKSGRCLEVWTTEPAIQFYTGNFITDKVVGKDGSNLTHRGALALEPQHTPNSINLPDYPSTVLRPGEKYHSATEYRFSTVD